MLHNVCLNLKNFLEPSRAVLDGSDHILNSILQNLMQHVSSPTQIALSESSHAFTISIKVGRGKATKGDNIKVQKYLEDEGVEK